MVRISPSILSADPLDLRSDIDRALRSGIDMFHIDVMDGHFVPNITFGLPLVGALSKHLDAQLDVHLMITDPEGYAPLFVKAGADIVTVHVEATEHLDRVLSSIRECGAKCGVTLNPNTPIDALRGVLDRVDLVLIMSVDPGFGGQSFIRGSLERVRELVRMRDDLGVDVPIEIDGGMTPLTVPDVVEAGVDIVVAGSAVFSANGRDIEKNIEALRQGIRQGLDRRN
ncbi:MAG: ribulose-phosphate 3-epimerase [Candidatus Thermoplasmatota archaeon]|nr:ribulose-phosphate 3-epimerase [Candidatus Thermoplasmatota archaeon]